MSIIFLPLYFLESPSIILVEIKRTDNTNETDLSKIYYWFVFNKKTTQLTHCTFINMQQTDTLQMRTFAQGSLQFDQQRGTFTDTHQTTHALTRVEPAALAPTLYQSIHDYLQTQSQA